MHASRPESLNIDISKYKGVKEGLLLRWIVELHDAIGARVVSVQLDQTLQTVGLKGQASIIWIQIVSGLQESTQTDVWAATSQV